MPPNPGHSRKFYSKVTVLGAGSFGTAMAMSCARNKVRLREPIGELSK